MKKTHPDDRSNEEWACLKTHLPVSKLPGRLRANPLRDIFDANLLRLGERVPLADVARCETRAYKTRP
jgi:hypothetical protein